MKKLEENAGKPSYLADLTPKQIKALPFLASGVTATEASNKLGISQQQISSWQRDDNFQIALNAVRRDAMRDAETALSGLAMNAVKTLRESLNSASSEQTRLRAAMYIIDRLGFSSNMELLGPAPSGSVNMTQVLLALGGKAGST